MGSVNGFPPGVLFPILVELSPDGVRHIVLYPLSIGAPGSIDDDPLVLAVRIVVSVAWYFYR